MAKATLPATPVILIFIFLLVIIVGLLVWALINFQKATSRAANVIQNPYCLRVRCRDGSEGEPVEDQQRKAYQTVNWCTVNAPPSSFYQVIKKCEISSNSDLKDKLEKFIPFYLDDYVPSCGYSWKLPYDVALSDGSSPGKEGETGYTDPGNPRNPNNPETLNGLNDRVASTCLACAEKLGLSGPDIDRLRDLVS